MNEPMRGIILKGIGGFYYVEAASSVYECHARGIFRKDGITPVAGDSVEITPDSDRTGSIDRILERKNLLTRPPVANIDRLFILVSVCDPAPNLQITDKMTAIAQKAGIEPIVIVTKTDLEDGEEIAAIYRKCKMTCVLFSSVTGEGAKEIGTLLRGKISAFTGNSGVGKSTLLNSVFPDFSQKTGEISKKLGRGRHTTREVSLFKLPCGGYVADTPGFSSLDTLMLSGIKKEELWRLFPEFSEYTDQCRFISCSHTVDSGCAVIEAVQERRIPPSRHESYQAIYAELREMEKQKYK